MKGQSLALGIDAIAEPEFNAFFKKNVLALMRHPARLVCQLAGRLALAYSNDSAEVRDAFEASHKHISLTRVDPQATDSSYKDPATAHKWAGFQREWALASVKWGLSVNKTSANTKNI